MERDWWCEVCQFNIYGKKDQCRKCGSHRPGAVNAVPNPAAAVVGPRHYSTNQRVVRVPLRTGDWFCSACNVQNFASRQACFKCKVPKFQPGGPQTEEVVTAATRECVVCMNANPAVVFLPCKHMACCSACANRVEEKCPICRTAIQSKIEPFRV